MKRFSRQIFVLAVGVSLLAVATPPSEAAQRAAPLTHTYDGLWSVLIMTRYGNCDPAYRYAVRIEAGRVANSGEGQDYQAYGAVGYGRLSRNYGRGQWRTSTGQCGGEWTAVRR
jgi:hypothetical protein